MCAGRAPQEFAHRIKQQKTKREMNYAIEVIALQVQQIRQPETGRNFRVGVELRRARKPKIEPTRDQLQLTYASVWRQSSRTIARATGPVSFRKNCAAVNQSSASEVSRSTS
jgi:hypothetical protein